MHPVISFPGSLFANSLNSILCYVCKRNAHDPEVNQSDLQIQIWYNITAIFQMSTNIQDHTFIWGGGGGGAMSLAEVENMGALQSFTLGGFGAWSPI